MANEGGSKDSAPTTSATTSAPPAPTPPPASEPRANPPPAPAGAAGAAAGTGTADFFDPSFVQSLLGQVWLEVSVGVVVYLKLPSALRMPFFLSFFSRTTVLSFIFHQQWHRKKLCVVESMYLLEICHWIDIVFFLTHLY